MHLLAGKLRGLHASTGAAHSQLSKSAHCALSATAEAHSIMQSQGFIPHSKCKVRFADCKWQVVHAMHAVLQAHDSLTIVTCDLPFLFALQDLGAHVS